MSETKKKNPVINVTEENKKTINEFKKTHKLSDKEFVDVALQVLEITENQQVVDVIAKLKAEKELEKINAKIAKTQAELEELTKLTAAKE